MIDKLSALGIKPCTDRLTAGFELRTADAAALARQRVVDPARPLVSCLMVTRGNPEILRHSSDCYARQSWTNRELVVVTSVDKTDAVAAVLREQGLDNVTLAGADPGLSLGDLRNMAVARARGDILVQWDDDDLSDPLRVATAVAVLTQTNAAAAFLDRWLIWWPRRNLAALCRRRLCEGTIAIWRNAAPTYPAMARGEDSIALAHLGGTIALIDAPLQYVYTITGENTWDDAHFEDHLAGCEHRFEGDDYRAICDLLAERVPLAAYEASLKRLWALGGAPPV